MFIRGCGFWSKEQIKENRLEKCVIINIMKMVQRSIFNEENMSQKFILL